MIKKEISKRNIIQNKILDVFKAKPICPICLDICKNPVVASCGHVYCWSCLYEWYKESKHECPQCKLHLNLNDTSKTNDTFYSKYTKPVKLVHPGLSNNARFFGNNVLENDVRDMVGLRPMVCIVVMMVVCYIFSCRYLFK